MAKDSAPDFRVNVYGDQPGGVEDISRSMAFGGASGGGGFPWFGGGNNSPTFPNNPGTSAPPPPLDANLQPWELTPYAGGQQPPGAPGAGAGGIGGFLNGLSARDKIAIVTALAGTVGGAMSKPQNMSPTTATSDPNLQALMQAMQRRLDKSEPLYDSVLNMANGLLPTQYQKGGGGMG